MDVGFNDFKIYMQSLADGVTKTHQLVWSIYKPMAMRTKNFLHY